MHSSHLKIWRRALAHYKAFPVERRLRTWHKVSVTEEGCAVGVCELLGWDGGWVWRRLFHFPF
jgi:hypothetical protein